MGPEDSERERWTRYALPPARMIIAIDGPAGSGKSTVAVVLARDHGASIDLRGYAHQFRDEQTGDTHGIVLDSFGEERGVLEVAALRKVPRSAVVPG